tara:strand:- start:375 stop:962 length:588 start_codon:yes stop_codon:yes gene_type:complete
MSFKLKNTEAFLTSYANKLIRLSRLEIEKPRQRTYNSIKFGSRTLNKPLDSSGKLKDSLMLEKKVVRKGDFFQFNVKGNAYGEKVDEGTKSGTSPSVSQLVAWIDTKPVTLQDSQGNSLSSISPKGKNRIANQIAQKIKREGIKPTNFLTDLINKEIDNVLGVTPEIIKDINMDLDGFMKKLGYKKQGDTFKLQK